MKTYKIAEWERRFEKLVSVTKTQCSKGNYDQDEYMRGLANGLILAESIMEEIEPAFIPHQK